MYKLNRCQSLFLLSWLLLAAVLVISGCERHPPAAQELPGAKAAAATRVQYLAQRLRDNDLVGYAKAMTTPEQYQRAEQAWREGRSLWPLTEMPLSAELPQLLVTLSKPGAAKSLQRSFDSQLAGQQHEIQQAVQSMGMFGVQYLRNHAEYTPEQRACYVQWVQALTQWAGTAPLADRDLAVKALAELTMAARKTGLDSPEALREAGMEESLRRLEPFFAVFKQVLANYNLSLDTTFEQLQAGQINQQGKIARVRFRYPLAAATIDTTASLVKLEGQWYLQRSQEELQQLLADPAAPAAADSATEQHANPATGR